MQIFIYQADLNYI